MSLPNRYALDTTVTVAAAYTARATGQPVDPATVGVAYMPPNGTIQSFTYGVDNQVVRDGVGLYHLDIDGVTSGLWLYRWTGSGPVDIASADTRFIVDPSELASG